MLDPLRPKLTAALLFVFAPLFIAAPPASAQAPNAPAQQVANASAASSDPSAERGAQLYRRGEWKAAAKEFRAAVKRSKEDPSLWLYLGRALLWNGDMKGARKSFEESLRLKPDSADARANLAYVLLLSGDPRGAEAEAAGALKSDPSSAEAHYTIGLLRLHEGAWLKALAEADTVIGLAPNSAAAYMLKTQALLGLYERGNVVLADERRGVYDFDEKTIEEARAAQPLRLREAAESFERYVALSPNAPDVAAMREQLEALRYYAEAAASPDPARRIHTAAETTTRAVITMKPEPAFTEEARRAHISGVVRLRAVLGADGGVHHILVVKGLSHGLTERAVSAARGIRFKPATLNGNPVSQYVTLEYNFNIY